MTARIALCAAALAAVAGAPAPAAAQDAGAQGPVITAMKAELARAAKLSLPDMAAPYYVAYTITDTHALTVAATLGALVTSEPERSRDLRVVVRVGDPSFDNTNFSDSRSFFSFAGGAGPLPIEDDAEAIQWALWVATDAGYKTAAEDLEKKRAARAGKKAAADAPADFSAETVASVDDAGGVAAALLDRTRFERGAKAASAVFAGYPDIHDSSVTVSARGTVQHFASTEGTASRQAVTGARIEIVARTQAADGMPLRHHAVLVATTEAALPSDADLEAAARRVADELIALRDAPVLDAAYTGPVLFEGKAAAQLVAAVVAPALIGTPPPEDDDARMSRMMGGGDSAWADRLGKRVLPASLSIVDDPSAAASGPHALAGGYRFDAEGVPAQAVSLVERGVLKTLLMSRTPRKQIARSNGHARAGGFGPVRAQIANLVVTATGGLAAGALEKKLVQAAKRRDNDAGLVVALLDDPAVTGVDRAAQQSVFMAMASGQSEGAPVPQPILVYRVKADGSRQLVRGAQLAGVSARRLLDATAGKATAVHHAQVTTMTGPFAMMTPRGGEPASVVAPALLVDDLDVKVAAGPHEKLPVAPSPL